MLVLGSHRSGTSAITGLLAEAGGLVLGDVMPPTSANPKGAFESTGVVKAHNEILGSLDRDWTCPPNWFDPSTVVTAGLASAVRVLADADGTWGVKDPRLLFMLPAWTDLVGHVRFVGVLRDHEEVVRSIVSRDGIDPGVADAIARAHVMRLRQLRDVFDFPIIDFSAAPSDVVAAAGAVATGIGLAWDQQVAEDFLDPSMTRARGRGALVNQDVHLLRERVGDLWRPEVVASDRLAQVLSELDPIEQLDRYSGPRASARRRRAWSAVPRELADVREMTRNMRMASSVDPAPDRAIVAQCGDLLSLYRLLRASDARPDAVVLPDLTSWVPRGDLVAAFELVHDHVADHGLVVVGVSRADRDTAAMVDRRPLSVEEVCNAARSANFIVLTVSDDDLMAVVRLVVRPTTDRPSRTAPHGGLASGDQPDRPDAPGHARPRETPAEALAEEPAHRGR